ILLILFFSLLLSCGVSKNSSSKNNLTRIDYRVEESNKVADSLWDEIKNKKSGVEKSSSTAMMKKMENPPPSFYRLSLKDTVSKTEHRESLQKEEESQLTYSSAPFYNMDGFNFRD